MRGFASLLQSRHAGQLDERGSLYVDRIAANAEFLSRLLNDLLELSRVGRLEEPDEDLPVADIVRQVIDDLAEPTQTAGVTIRQPEFWPQVRFSRVRLRQIWSNLLSNAIKFLGQQTAPRIEVGWRILPQDVDLEREDAPATIWAEFWVRDNGIGIHPEYQQRIFRPFQRLKVVEVDGTGVGLSIVRRIVEGRGGTVRVESAPGQGATFYFTAPLAEASGALRGEALHVATGTPHLVD
jgi:signal transduction histidine kinase